MQIKKLDEHFSRHDDEKNDAILGDKLARFIGDTFIDFRHMNPIQQWTRVVKALRVHGLKIEEV